MKIARRVAVATLGALASIPVAVAVTGPAAASSSQCGSGYFCVWSDPEYNGTFFNRIVRSESWSASGIPNMVAMVNKDSALWNRTLYNQSIYHLVNYTGIIVCLPPTYKVGAYSYYQDRAASHYDSGGQICGVSWVRY
jgi:hypothetical protein